MIDTDTRQLKLAPDGKYTTGRQRSICGHCGLSPNCPIKPLTRCAVFMPLLPFNDETGLDLPSNTVRIGAAWPKRLVNGQTIALYNVKRQVIFGHAQVTSMHTGNIMDMLDEHAHANHLMLDTPKDDAAATLFKWQRQQYGPRIVHEEANLTAIYLLRIAKQDAAPNK